MSKSRAELEALRDKINALKPSDRLRLAADLLDHGKGPMAHTIAERVVHELGAALLLGGNCG